MGTATLQYEPAAFLLLLLLPLVIYAARHGVSRLPSRQRHLSLTVRLLILSILVGAVANPRLVSETQEPFVVLAVDQSRSISPVAEQRAKSVVADIQKRADANGIDCLTFPFAQAAGMPNRRKTTDDNGTNLAAAILEATLSVPASNVGHIAVLSDGNETEGDSLATARASAIPISTIPLPSPAENEVAVIRVDTPTRVRRGEPFEITVVVESSSHNSAVLSLLNENEVVDSRKFTIEKGLNRLTTQHSVFTEGEAVLTVAVEPAQDEITDNNRATGTISVGSLARVLVVEGQSGGARALADTLRNEAMDVTLIQANALAAHRPTRRYDLIVLTNVPQSALASIWGGQNQKHLEQFIRGGGGLLVIGGDRAFAPGGYANTPLEDLLPVTSHVSIESRTPALAMVLVLDQSSSMHGQNITLAREAARLVVDNLDTNDQVGVIAFEDAAHWVVDVAPLANAQGKQVILDRIDTLAVGTTGGTNMGEALDKAFLALHETDAERKHMIVLTDGLSHPADFAGLSQEIAKAGITVSTVAVGSKAADRLLREIARDGNGQFHACSDPNDIPEIFVQETIAASGRGIAQGDFRAELREHEPAVDTSTSGPVVPWSYTLPSPTPRLHAYNETQLKDGAHSLLVVGENTPLLALWPMGKGTAACFTSDVGGRWTATWPTWNGFGRFWHNVAWLAMRTNQHTVASDQFAVAYAKEFRLLPTNESLLKAIAEESGGRYAPTAEQFLTTPDQVVRQAFFLRPYLCVCALLLFVIDVSLKRIDFSQLKANE